MNIGYERRLPATPIPTQRDTQDTGDARIQ